MLSDRHQADELPHINMTPMVDVVLCLLVFFMAATRLYDWDENEFAVSVPEVAEAGPLTAAPDDLIAHHRQPGQVAVGETTYDLDRLGELLREARAALRRPGGRDPGRRRRSTTRTWPTSSPPATRPASATSGSPSARATSARTSRRSSDRRRPGRSHPGEDPLSLRSSRWISCSRWQDARSTSAPSR